MLLSRCRRLVNKDFLSIIRDMAPDGLGQVETLRGRTEEEEEENGSS
jgi:type VI secretion system protein ImpA